MFEESVSFIPSIWASMNSWLTPTVLFVFLNLMIGTIFITSRLATEKSSDQQKLQQQQLARTPSVLQRLKSINFYNYKSPELNTNFAQTQAPPGSNSHFTSHFNYEQELENPKPQLPRSPSMLQKLKSINLYNYLSQESPALDKTQEAEDIHYSPNQEQEHPLEREQDDEGEEEEEEGHFQDQVQSLDEIYNQLKGSNMGRTKSDTKPASGEILKKLPKKMKKSASSKSAFNHFKGEDIVEVEARRPATVKEFGNPKVTQVDDEGVDAKADDFINKFKLQLKLQRIDSITRYKEMINRGAGTLIN